MSVRGRPPGMRGNVLHAPDDPDTQALLREAILKNGLHPRSAAERIGIPTSTFYDWMAACPAFSASVKSAVAELKANLAKTVMDSAMKKKNWVAAMTMLERLFPDEYGRKDRVRHDHAGTVGLQIEPAKLSLEDALMMADIEARLGEAERLSLPAHRDTEAASG